MKTFIFIQQNGSAVITLSADNFEDANTELVNLVGSDNFDDFRCEDEEGKDEN